MRCLFLTFNFLGQGTYLRAEAFAKLFAARGHEVTIVCANGRHYYRRRETAADGIRRVEMPSWMPLDLVDRRDAWNPLDLAGRLAHTARRPYDLVYAFESRPTTYWPARMARWRGATLLLDRCDAWGGPEGHFRTLIPADPHFRRLAGWRRWVRRRAFAFEERLERKGPRVAAATTTISRLLRDETMALGVAEDRVARIYTPASLAHLAFPSKDAARAELGIRADAAVLGYLSNAVYDEEATWHQCRTMMDALPTLELLFVGPGFRNVPGWATAGPLAPRVHVTGHVPFERMLAALAASDILWCPLEPARYNAARFPHKFFDYIAAGRPVFAGDVGDIGELVRAHDLGGVAADTASLARATTEALASPERWPAWGDNARRLATTAFSADAITAQFEELLAGVLPASRRF